MAMRPTVQAPGIDQEEFEAGPDHVIVLYQPHDTSTEVDAGWIFGSIAADAAPRADSGLRMLSMTSMPLRHAGTAWGNDGSGYQTKVAVAVLYERSPAASG